MARKNKRLPSSEEIEAAINDSVAQNEYEARNRINNQQENCNAFPEMLPTAWQSIGRHQHEFNSKGYTGRVR